MRVVQKPFCRLHAAFQYLVTVRAAGVLHVREGCTYVPLSRAYGIRCFMLTLMIISYMLKLDIYRNVKRM
jgi:hypothetical protein